MLDLQTAPPLCDAALGRIRSDFARTYRPRGDDPRSYDELLARLGTAAPLNALIWLAGHGCSSAAALGDAAELVGTYRDSPERTTMLDTLARLRRGP